MIFSLSQLPPSQVQFKQQILTHHSFRINQHRTPTLALFDNFQIQYTSAECICTHTHNFHLARAWILQIFRMRICLKLKWHCAGTGTGLWSCALLLVSAAPTSDDDFPSGEERFLINLRCPLFKWMFVLYPRGHENTHPPSYIYEYIYGLIAHDILYIEWWWKNANRKGLTKTVTTSERERVFRSTQNWDTNGKWQVFFLCVCVDANQTWNLPALSVRLFFCMCECVRVCVCIFCLFIRIGLMTIYTY